MLFKVLYKLNGWRIQARDAWLRGHNKRTLLIVLLILFPLIAIYFDLVRAPSSFPVEDIVTIEEGDTLTQVARQLERDHVVRSAFAFRMAVTVLGGDKGAVAGDYQFHRPRNVISLARAITTGTFGLEPVRVRIPEGATSYEMAEIYARRLPRFNKENFVEQAQPFEGYLFPDTYFFLPNTTEDQVIKTMLNNFQIQIAEIQTELAASERSIEDLVIMASLLEKEARNYTDRRKIAGVLWRRIDMDMLLQVDAAFLYFLGRTTFDLTLEDLRYDSPYNTYKYKGLPVGPIANPGLDALKAAATPIDDGYLFYLADRNFVTHYSKTYEEHLRKKRMYLD